MISRLPDPELDPAFYDSIPAKRFFAWVVDVTLIALLALLASLLTLGLLLWVFPLVYLALSFAYRSLTISSWSATPGMRLMNLELRNQRGEILAPTEAVFHSGVYLFCWGFGILQMISVGLMALQPSHRGLHDMFLGTAAINRPR